jgi:hypothetical protein
MVKMFPHNLSAGAPEYVTNKEDIQNLHLSIWLL